MTTQLCHISKLSERLLTQLPKQYSNNKGFCEDLTEGKFSFPIIHSIRSNPNSRTLQSNYPSYDHHGTIAQDVYNLQLEAPNHGEFDGLFVFLGILKQRPTEPELKRHAIKIMNSTGSFEYCRTRLAEYEKLARDEIRRLGGNARLELTLDRLTIPRADDGPAEPSSH